MHNCLKFVKSLYKSPLIIFICLACLINLNNSCVLAANEIKTCSGIVINEILPSPEGPDEKEEYIEIFNQNNSEADISFWKITDTGGKTTTYTFPKGTKILANGFLLLNRPKTKITLNNNDGLNLIEPNGKIVDSVSYEKAPEGKSYNRSNNKWVWSETLTPGKTNITPAPILKTNKVESPEKNITPETGLAAVGSLSLKNSVLIIALIIAIFSAGIILALKKNLEKGDL